MYYRRLPKFEYLAPASIKEATSLLKKHKGKARITAGGTIVVHRMKERVGVRKILIGLKGVSELDYITHKKTSGLIIGCMADLQSVADSKVVKENYGILATVCGKLGTPQIRSMGTIGGNVSCKLPEAETVPALIALGAEAEIITADGKKTVDVESLNRALKQTDLLLEIRVPTPASNAKWGYQRYTIREGIDYATVSAAVMLTSSDDICKDIKIGLGGVSTGKRAGQAENVIKGKKITDNLIKKTAQAASKNAKTASDIYFSAKYKQELLKVLVEDAIRQALSV